MAAEFGSLDRGVLTTSHLMKLANDGALQGERPIRADQFQPASLDLTLSREAYKLPGSVLPLRGESVRSLIDSFHARPLDLAEPSYLDRGQVYLIRLNESFRLPHSLSAYTNNRSSIGRIDVQTRTLADGHPRYDKVPAGYGGELWIELISKSFDLRVRAGISFNQAILYQRRAWLGEEELRARFQRQPLLWDARGKAIDPATCIQDEGLLMSVDLQEEVVGWAARRSPEPVVLDEPRVHEALEFFEPLRTSRRGVLLLARGRFHILSTAERILVPRDLAVEMLPYDAMAGEFRAHYAGFFDPGFGEFPGREQQGTAAVLELRSYDDDLMLRPGQPICKMAYEHLATPTERPYGADEASSHYARQRGPRLARFFRMPD